MKTSGKVVDDLSKSDPIYLDLKYFETNFGGVMPFEISINTHKKNGVMKMSTIERIDELQQYIRQYPEFTKPLSLAEGIKFARQTFYSGDSSQYTLLYPVIRKKRLFYRICQRKQERAVMYSNRLLIAPNNIRGLAFRWSIWVLRKWKRW